jgi:NADH:ubiquinone oxidoreductase subunit E
MLTITVCVGSSCYVRGSERVVEILERLVRREGLDGRVEMTGAYCMERCSMGVSVRVNERVFSEVHPADAERFFYEQVMPHVEAEVRE